MLNDFWYILIHCSIITSSLRFCNGCLPRTQHPSGEHGSSAGNGCPLFLEISNSHSCLFQVDSWLLLLCCGQCWMHHWVFLWRVTQGLFMPIWERRMNTCFDASFTLASWSPAQPASLVSWADGDQALRPLIIHGYWKQRPRESSQMQRGITGWKLGDVAVLHTALMLSSYKITVLTNMQFLMHVYNCVYVCVWMYVRAVEAGGWPQVPNLKITPTVFNAESLAGLKFIN